MLIISCIMVILAIMVGFSERNTLQTSRMVLTVLVSIGLVFIGSWLLSKVALSPIKAAWQKQLDFTADASHELRTPLATIQTNLDVVMSNPATTVESQMKWLKNIEIENKRMSTLVSDLLFLSRADTDEITLEKKVFDLSLIFAEIIATYDAVIKQKGISLTSSITNGVIIKGDKDKIRQLLIILLDNAIKYNKDSGDLRISLFLNEDDVNIKISDTGIGINRGEMEKIFNRFYRGEKSRQKNPDGSGLGLAIAKMIATEHKGTIFVDSKIGEGSDFTVRLPLSC